MCVCKLHSAFLNTLTDHNNLNLVPSTTACTVLNFYDDVYCVSEVTTPIMKDLSPMVQYLKLCPMVSQELA